MAYGKQSSTASGETNGIGAFLSGRAGSGGGIVSVNLRPAPE